MTLTCVLNLAHIRPYIFTLDFDPHAFIPGGDPRRAVPLSPITGVEMNDWMGKHGVISPVTVSAASGQDFRLVSYEDPRIGAEIRFLVILVVGSGGQAILVFWDAGKVLPIGVPAGGREPVP